MALSYRSPTATLTKSASDPLARDNYAYDISKNVISKGEVKDIDAIKQSLEMIIGTLIGERIFSGFGCNALTSLFRNFTAGNVETILNRISEAVKVWDPRIRLDEPNMRLVYSSDDPNSFLLYIPFSVRPQNITSVFQKKILL
jgi:phage baseplate assembly protein W